MWITEIKPQGEYLWRMRRPYACLFSFRIRFPNHCVLHSIWGSYGNSWGRIDRGFAHPCLTSLATFAAQEFLNLLLLKVASHEMCSWRPLLRRCVLNCVRWPFVDLCTFFAWQAPEIGHRMSQVRGSEPPVWQAQGFGMNQALPGSSTVLYKVSLRSWSRSCRDPCEEIL